MIEAVTEAPGSVSVQQRSSTVVASVGQVALAVERVGICGSDAHFFEGTHPYLGYPRVQGHEIVGTVVDVGPGVSPTLLGQRAVVEPTAACGLCIACRRGRPNCCVDLTVVGISRAGGLTELLLLESGLIHPVGDLHPDAAVFVEPLAVALQAVRRGAVTADDLVLVLGAGSIGRSTVLAARAAGARVMVADRLPARRRLALLLGAERAVGHEELTDAVGDFSRGEGPTVVIDATGAAALLRRGLDLVAPSGTVVVVGISEDELCVPVSLLSRKEVALLGSRNSVGAFPDALALATANADVLRATISHRFPLASAEEAMRAAAGGGAYGKVVVDVTDGRGS